MRVRVTRSGSGSSVLALALFAVPAAAQSVSDYQLPPAPKEGPVLEGPVDTENPVVAPTVSVPTPRPSPTAQPAPAPAPTARATPSPPVARPETVVPRVRQTPAVQPQARTGATVAQPSPQPEPAPRFSPLPPAESEEPTPVASPQVVAGAEAPDDALPWWMAIPVVLVLLLAGLLLWSRRGSATATAQDEGFDRDEGPADIDTAPSAPAALPPVAPRASLPPPAPPPKPAAAPASSPSPIPRPSFGAAPSPLRFEPVAMRLSLFYATMSYRLEVTRPREHEGPMRVLGDIISAHASLGSEAQLAPDTAALAELHDLASLEPGNTAELKGEIQLPLNAIVPVKGRASALFFPLARFVLDMPGRAPLVRIYSVGQAPDRPEGALRPFRLDTGPRNFAALDRREIERENWVHLDGAGKAG